MARFSSLARIVPVSAATLLAFGVLAAPTSASAKSNIPGCSPNCYAPPSPPQNLNIPKVGNKYDYGLNKKYGYGGGKNGGGNGGGGYGGSYGNGGGYGNKFGGGWGYGAAALGGMAVGLVAASAASAHASQDSAYAGDCYLVRRRAIDEDGNMYIRRVRVCE